MTVEAIYSGGVLKPLQPLESIAENERVVLTITRINDETRKHPFDGWVGGMSEEDAAEMMRIIEEEFEQIDPDDWKDINID